MLFFLFLPLLGCSRNLGSMARINGLYPTYKWGMNWGEITHLLTIDPNFLGHPSGEDSHFDEHIFSKGLKPPTGQSIHPSERKQKQNKF